MEENEILEQTTDISVENEQVADVQQEEQVTEAVNTKTERDSYFADQRRKQELDDARAELEALKKQNQRAEQTLKSYFEGNSLEDMLDYAQSQQTGVSIDEIKAQNAALARQAELEQQLDFYRQKDIEREMEADLKAIQEIDPKITSLNEMSELFYTLRFNEKHPVSAKEAYLAVKAIENQTKQPKPASLGSMTGAGKAESEFFTSAELDRLTAKDLDDPKVMEKALRSMARLK